MTEESQRKRVDLAPEALEEHAEKIIDSGALGRSKVYASLLRYLVNYAKQGSSPKEIEIAIEVLGRDSDFDVAKDSAVRVYIHQLRKKLDLYYEKYAPDAPYRLAIPKGQYIVEAVEPASSVATDGESEDSPTGAAQDANQSRTNRSPRLWPVLIALLLAANLLYLMLGSWGAGSERPEAASHPLWEPILSDDTPILVVMGDYYIFGELDEAGNVDRMIRDFDINSQQDLESLFAEQPQLGWQYRDLSLSYLPEGSASALNHIAPLLQSTGKPVQVKMMSELNTRDIQRQHIVYIGYISALDRISNMVFSASNLRSGQNYDQLINSNSGQVYTSDAGLPSFDRPFVDYGWFATFPATQQTRMVIVTGMRDSGLIHTAQAVTAPGELSKVDERLGQSEQDESTAFEAVYRVRGMDRMNFAAQIEYSDYMNAQLIWRDEFELGAER